MDVVQNPKIVPAPSVPALPTRRRGRYRAPRPALNAAGYRPGGHLPGGRRGKGPTLAGSSAVPATARVPRQPRGRRRDGRAGQGTGAGPKVRPRPVGAVLLSGPLQRWPMSARSAPGKDALSTGSGPIPPLPRPGQCCGLLVAAPPLGGTPRSGVRRQMRGRAPARTPCLWWRLPEAATPVSGAIHSSEGPWRPTEAPRRPKGPSRVTRPTRVARPGEPAFPLRRALWRAQGYGALGGQDFQRPEYCHLHRPPTLDVLARRIGRLGGSRPSGRLPNLYRAIATPQPQKLKLRPNGSNGPGEAGADFLQERQTLLVLSPMGACQRSHFAPASLAPAWRGAIWPTVQGR